MGVGSRYHVQDAAFCILSRRGSSFTLSSKVLAAFESCPSGSERGRSLSISLTLLGRCEVG